MTGAHWDRLAGSHPDCSVFHTSAWAQVVCQTYGHKAEYLFLTHQDEAAAVVPIVQIRSPITGRRGVCIPFADACGPLAFRKQLNAEMFEQMRKFAKEQAWDYFEFRGGDLLDETAQPAEMFYGHSLKLPSDSDRVFGQFGNGTKGAIKQALKNGLVAEVSHESSAVEEFYSLQVKTRKKHGLPPQPFRFFANLQRILIRNGGGFTVLARLGSATVAGAIFLRTPKHAIYKYAASDPDFAKSRGNNLVLWEAIRHLCRSGCELLHLGRTSLDHEGLRRFKLSWGADEQVIRYFRFDLGRECWVTDLSRDKEGLHTRVFRRLPSVLNRLAGSLLYPHLD